MKVVYYSILLIAFGGVITLCNSKNTNSVGYHEFQIKGDGGNVTQDANGLLYVSLNIKVRCDAGPISIQPWWYSSYEIDRGFGNVYAIPLPYTTLPSTNAPELKSVVIDQLWQAIQVELTSKNHGGLWRVRTNEISNQIHFRMRYKAKDVSSNWEQFDLKISDNH
jgi:hypothetical protein